jgi:hypothetical protein
MRCGLSSPETARPLPSQELGRLAGAGVVWAELSDEDAVGMIAQLGCPFRLLSDMEKKRCEVRFGDGGGVVVTRRPPGVSFWFRDCTTCLTPE